jgi:molybdopterin-guanine dinucleotide biosynthesis protein A
MTISAVLLAGGESTRMRQDKATLLWRGRPLWEQQLEKLRALQPKQIFLSARSDPTWRPTDVELIVDLPPSRGPLSGLASVLAVIGTDHVLALAVDMPFMTTINLRGLCNRVSEGVGVIPIIAGTAEPLAAVYPKEACTTFLKALQSDDFSLQPIVARLTTLNRLRAVAVSDSDRRLYKSINEPSDLDLSG